MFGRTALVALGLTAVLAPGALAASDRKINLDGQRSTSASYNGTLTGPTVYAGMVTNGSVGSGPDPSWCTPETCDKQDLTLRLPLGRQSGRLVVELTQTDGSAQLHFVVYDDEGRPLPGQSFCCGSSRYVASRMDKGSYTIVVYDDAGAGSFEVDVTWKANPPHRTSPGTSS